MVGIQIRVPNWVDRILAWPMMVYRKWKYGYTFRRIDLGNGMWTIVDEEDYYRYCNMKWGLAGHGSKFYAVRTVVEGDKIKTERLHRLIMNAPKGKVVDHRNGESLDNRRANLRLATHRQNMQNVKKRKNTSSRYRGVWFEKGKGKWVSRIRYKDKRIFVGSFDVEIEAARAYDAAARKYHKVFARLNFPENQENPLTQTAG